MFIFLGLILLPVPAFAEGDMGLPMIMLLYPMMIFGLIPVIMIENFVMKKSGVQDAWKGLTVANLVSTLIGVPIVWIALFALQLCTHGEPRYDEMSTLKGRIIAVTWQAAWEPYANSGEWIVPYAALILLIPFFGMSYFVERWILKKMIKNVPVKEIYKLCFKANIASYCFLAGFIVLFYKSVSYSF